MPADTLGAVPTVSLRIGASAAFPAVPLAKFLAYGKSRSFWMADAVHIFGGLEKIREFIFADLPKGSMR